MAITVSSTGTERTLTPAGNHIARCFSMVDVGTIQSEWQGQVKTLRKVRIGFELPNELHVFKEENGEQPFTIYKTYTASLGEKANLRKDLESWRGKAFNDAELKEFAIDKLLGVPCMINVIHNVSNKGNTYSKISSITPIPKGMEAPEQIHPTFIFDYTENFDKLTELPDFIQEEIKSSKEYAEVAGVPEQKTESVQQEPEENFSDKLPF